MRKVLVLADSPTGVTGFSKVCKHICNTLYDTGDYEIVIIGINYDGSPPSKFPYEVHPATSAIIEKYNDVYGRKKTLDYLSSGMFDIFFTIQDMGVSASYMSEVKKIYDKLPQNKKFVSITYTPVDSKLITQSRWITDGLVPFDFPVTYTEYGKKEITSIVPIKNLDICGHGADFAEFFPLPAEDIAQFKKTCITGLDLSNKFIVLNVNRNQIRKDYLRCFRAFAEFKKEVPCAFLFCLAQINDQGGNLLDLATQCGLKYGVDWYAPNDYTSHHGYPIEAVNMIYNMADVVFSTTIGEGWGLSSVEAMAVGKPCVFPGNTSLTEIFGGGERGYLIPSGEDIEHWITYGLYDSSLVRPVINIKAAAKLLKKVFTDPKDAKEKVDAARKWIEENTWEKVNQFWVKKFSEASAEVDRRRSESLETPASD